MRYQPPLTLTPAMVSLVAEIAEAVGRLSLVAEDTLRLRRINRIRTIQGSLAIEGNTLSEEQITAVLEGKPVLAPPREIQEARNALAAYEQMTHWQPEREADLLQAHKVLTQGLLEDAGRYRGGGVGVMQGEHVIHMAPPANRVPGLMHDLLAWLGACEAHPLIAGAVFHYEFEFIHPFADGNGRMGRLWQTLILSRWQPVLADLPVESMVHAHQQAYYRAIEQSTAKTDCAPFVHFMLERILEACRANTPQVTREVTPPSKAVAGRARQGDEARCADAGAGAEGCQALPPALPAACAAGGAGGNDPTRSPTQPDPEIPFDRGGPAARGKP